MAWVRLPGSHLPLWVILIRFWVPGCVQARGSQWMGERLQRPAPGPFAALGAEPGVRAGSAAPRVPERWCGRGYRAHNPPGNLDAANRARCSLCLLCHLLGGIHPPIRLLITRPLIDSFFIHSSLIDYKQPFPAKPPKPGFPKVTMWTPSDHRRGRCYLVSTDFP